jgi:hypothetical protein
VSAVAGADGRGTLRTGADALERWLPHRAPFDLPGFPYQPPPYGGLAFHYADGRSAAEEFDRFHGRVVEAVGRSFLPVYRMADGEFAFMVGARGLEPGLRSALRTVPRRVLQRVSGRTGTYWGEAYAGRERRAALGRFRGALAAVARTGVLAPYFALRGDGWGERYHRPVGSWLERHGIRLHAGNYTPFYSVYALLTGPRRDELLRGRRILVVTHLTEERRQGLEVGLEREGVADVAFLPVSRSRALFDDVHAERFRGATDLVLVAAGIGSVSVLAQLEGLGLPVIDCGIALECLIDPERRWERPFLVGSDRTDPDTVQRRRHF